MKLSEALIGIAEKWCVYIHMTADSGEVFYVGQSKSRHRKGVISFPRVASTTKRNRWWKSVASKHGFVSKIVAYFATKKEADAEEKRLIQTFGKREKGGVLVNLADGGEGNGGSPRTKEWRDRIAEAHRGRKLSAAHREKLRLAHTGKKLSELTKARIGAASRNHKNFRLADPEIKAKAQASRKQVKTAARTRDHQDKINAANRGQKRSAEARLKMSIAAKNRYAKTYAIAA